MESRGDDHVRSLRNAKRGVLNSIHFEDCVGSSLEESSSTRMKEARLWEWRKGRHRGLKSEPGIEELISLGRGVYLGG